MVSQKIYILILKVAMKSHICVSQGVPLWNLTVILISELKLEKNINVSFSGFKPPAMLPGQFSQPSFMSHPKKLTR